MKSLILVALLAITPASCSTVPKAPPNLSPQATTAWYGTQVIKVIDLVRDTAVDANKVSPPLLSTNTTRMLVNWHRSALDIVHQAPAGWPNAVVTGLVEVVRNLPETEKTILQPYVTLLITVVQEIH